MMFGMKACLVCHGWNAVAGGSAPDLRYSPVITDAATFRAVVRDGALKLNGMPPFPTLTDKELETIRFFLRARAQTAIGEKQAAEDKAKAANADTARPQDFAGKWNIVILTPAGEQKAVMDLKVNGNVITGRVTADQGSVDVAGGAANGRARVQGKASFPMPITVIYDMTVRDGELVGDDSNGPFGTFPFRGKR
jgi:quinohemoprotein ethanol dehydrogenase